MYTHEFFEGERTHGKGVKLRICLAGIYLGIVECSKSTFYFNISPVFLFATNMNEGLLSSSNRGQILHESDRPIEEPEIPTLPRKPEQEKLFSLDHHPRRLVTLECFAMISCHQIFN